jgi:alkyl hydroperoxide reductase subunit F
MLEATLKKQLQAYLEKVVQPIEIVASLDDANARNARPAPGNPGPALSDKISYLRTDGNDVRKPSFAMNRTGTDVGVRFAGLPLGHEFTSLVLALLQVGGHPIKFDRR